MDISGAQVAYPVNVNVDSEATINFNRISNVETLISEPNLIPLDIGVNDISIISWASNQNIDWICYSSNDNILYIGDTVKWSFNFGK